MAPRMSGRGGAALLCLSALLAHGKCRGADSGVKMRRAPLEGARRRLEKGEPPPPRTRSRRSQPGISAAARVTSSSPGPLAGEEAASPALGTEPGPGKGRGGGDTPILSWLGRRVQTRESGGVSAHGNLRGSRGSTRSCPGRLSFHSHPCSRRGWGLFGSAGIVSSPRLVRRPVRGRAARRLASCSGARKGSGLTGVRAAAAAGHSPPAVL